jgi:nicotinate-nucleotide pyrophosphorylase (carboxylating)
MDPLPPDAYRDLVARALAEDIGAGDITSEATVTTEQRGRGIMLAKSNLVLAGLEIAAETFRQCDGDVIFSAHMRDGQPCPLGTVVAEVAGSARALLTAERTALNFMQRLSGIATETHRYVTAAAGTIIVLDTRKTTPTLRVLEKYAVRCGGGTNHRYRLDDGVLIKDNHKRLAGGITAVLTRARAAGVGLPIEVEVESREELEEALAAGAERILLDNFAADTRCRTALSRPCRRRGLRRRHPRASPRDRGNWCRLCVGRRTHAFRSRGGYQF